MLNITCTAKVKISQLYGMFHVKASLPYSFCSTNLKNNNNITTNKMKSFTLMSVVYISRYI